MPNVTIDGRPYRPAFGVPYARAGVRGRNGTATCPRCGLVIVLRERKDFESMTGSEYAEHYNAEHATDDGRVLVDGVWYEPVLWHAT
jgi:uncharacterized C2H2 Zn-finger protein